MTILESLKEMGLNDGEADIYRVLLKMGASGASSIAKSAGVKRTTTYSILQNLKEKGFVGGYYKDDKQFFYAERPERVAGRYEKRLKLFVDVIPALVNEGAHFEKGEGIRSLTTIAELKDFYRDILDEYKNKSYRIIGNSQIWENLDPGFLFQFRKERAKNNTKTRLLLDSRSDSKNPKEQSLLRTWKYLPACYKFEGVIDIFNDKVLIISAELRSLALVIGTPAIVGMFKTMFDVIWDSHS